MKQGRRKTHLQMSPLHNQIFCVKVNWVFTPAHASSSTEANRSNLFKQMNNMLLFTPSPILTEIGI